MTASRTLPQTLSELGDIAEIRGSSAVAAELRRASAVIAALTGREAAALDEQVRRRRIDQPGVSPAIHWQIQEIAEGGAGVALGAAQSLLPRLPRRLLELGVLSTTEVLTLVRQLGILTTADLGTALDDGRVRTVLGEAMESRLRPAPDTLEMEVRPLILGRAWDLLEPVIAAIHTACPALGGLVPAGDVRRAEPLVSGLVLVGHAPDPQASLEAVCGLKGLDGTLHRSGRRAILAYQQTELDVRIVAPEEYGTVLFRATGSRPHVAALHQRRPLPRLAAREDEVYAQAGLPYIAPELRQLTGEIEAAAARALPALVDRRHIRGDLHLHTTYSDGRDTLAEMLAACAALGYEYIAITDHSERAAASRTLTRDRLTQQADEIARLQELYPAMAILHGVEVDILPDGRLDFADAVLERLDIVLASLHDSAGHDGRTLTRRCIQAIRHPLVTLITHPANQLVGRRLGYDLDFEAVYAAAAETGTALEIDGAPGHLDLDGAHAREAVGAGVTVSIDSDCHRAQALDRQMLMGIGTARRGWVEPRHVLNARPLAEVRAFITAKRTRRG